MCVNDNENRVLSSLTGYPSIHAIIHSIKRNTGSVLPLFECGLVCVCVCVCAPFEIPMNFKGKNERENDRGEHPKRSSSRMNEPK